jgi:Tfp pilus assembly protein PilV
VIKNNRGFTLAELVLAAFILSFVLSGLLLLFTNCMLLNDSSRNLSVATSHAEYILETIRGQDFADIQTTINSGGASGWDLTTVELSQSPYNFTTLPDETVATSVFQTGNPLGVLVNVSWLDRGLKARNTELRTFLTDY